MTDTTPDDSPLAFRDAMAELREILATLDEDEVDLDALSGLVERAAWLIQTCRERIQRTEMQVTRVLEGLEESTDAGPIESGSD